MDLGRMLIAGIDEAGRGPLAGPVTAAAVCLPAGYVNPAIADSKQLSAAEREALYPEICRVALAYSVVFLGPREIEELNILQATRMAMWRAAETVCRTLAADPSSEIFFLVDGNIRLDSPYLSEPVVKGDALIHCIAAASILAKVERDWEMQRLDTAYPGYGLADHKGYPTPRHRKLIAELGPSEIHRKTFAGVREYLRPRL